MASRPTTRDEGARVPAISRRALIAASPVAALATPKSMLAEPALLAAPAQEVGAVEDGVRRLKQWLALDRKIEQYYARWAQLEAWLVRECAWFTLSPAAQQMHPVGKELRDIDGCIDLLREKRDALLEALPHSAVCLDSIVTRLAVAERLIWPDDHPEAHALIVGARQDLIALRAGAG